MNRKNILRATVLLVIAAIFVVFFTFDLQQYLTLESIKQQQQQITRFYQGHLAATIAVFAGLYILKL